MHFPPATRLTRIDGRWWTVACLAIYFAALLTGQIRVGYENAWRRLGVPAMTPSFLDLRGTVDAAQSAREGYDPIVNNPHDPFQRPANYPHLWLYPILALHLHDADTAAVGVCLALAFYVAALFYMGPVTVGEGLAWGFFLCAPPAMLAVERGNNDLVVFILLAGALLARRRQSTSGTVGGYALVELCAFLKFFPFGVFSLALRERGRTAAAVLLAVGLVFAGYLYAIRAQVQAIVRVLPHSIYGTYGSNVLAEWYNAGHPGGLPPFVPKAAVLTLLLLAGAVRLAAPALPAMPARRVEGLLAGGVLYVGTFALNSNSCYRLIFWLFALPALWHLLRTPGFHRNLAGSLLVLMAVGWVLSCKLQERYFFVREAAYWAAFAGMAFLWLQCLPRPAGFRAAGDTSARPAAG